MTRYRNDLTKEPSQVFLSHTSRLFAVKITNREPKKLPCFQWLKIKKSPPDGGDGGCHIRCFVSGGACYKNIGSRVDGCGGGFDIYSSIDFDVEGKIPLGAQRNGSLDLGHDLVHKGLSAEPRNNGHAEEEVDVIEKWCDV